MLGWLRLRFPMIQLEATLESGALDHSAILTLSCVTVGEVSQAESWSEHGSSCVASCFVSENSRIIYFVQFYRCYSKRAV